MQHPHHKNTLLVTLVTLSFLTVLAFWLPQLKADVEGFAGGVQKSAQGLSTIDDQWRDAQEKIKELIPQPFKKEGLTPPPPQQEQQASPEMQQALSTAVQEAAREEEGEVKKESQLDPRFRSHCTRRAGFFQERQGPNTLRYGVCVFANGSECEAEMFFRDKCDIGQYTVAEDGIPKKPDLVILSAQVDRCVHRTQVCFSSIVVANRGWVRSQEATLAGGAVSAPIPALKSGDATSLDMTIPVTKNPEGQARITVDPQDVLKEIHEDNNVFTSEKQTP